MSTQAVTSGEFQPPSACRQEEHATAAFARLRDPFCILVWRFSVDSNHADCFVELCNEATEQVHEQPKCLFQRLTRDGREFQVRVGLEDSYGVLTHVATFSDTLRRAVAMARFCGLDIYGPGAELALLREPLAPFNPLFVELPEHVPV